jgi:predicted nuclease of predicted toxin-antitoxin system
MVTIPTPVLAQAWRGNSPIIARLMKVALADDGFDVKTARRVGELLGKSRTTDVVDAIVVLGAAARGDSIVTSDPQDIGRLVSALGKPIKILRI